MANSIVQVLPDGAGKKIQTFQNTVGANVVETQAIVQVDSAGVEVVAQTNALTDTQLRATPVPVSGTVTANAGTGTLAVSAASLPLPAGAATAAKQPAIGTAGTASVDVLTVQGKALMTPLLTDGSATTQPVSGTVTANAGTGTLAVSAASLPLPALAATSTKQSDGSQKSQVVDGSGNVIAATANALNVHIASGSSAGTEYTEDAVAAANPVAPAVTLVRQDTPAALTTADGDYVTQRGTNYGAGYAQIVTSAGAFVDTFGGGTQYTEDAVSAADPVGTAPILVRKDTPAAITSADGDNIAQRGTNYGAAYSQIVTSAGAFVDTFGGGTQYAQSAAAAADPTGTMGIAVAAASPAVPAGVIAGDNVALQGTTKGELFVKQTDAVSVTNTGTFAVQGAGDIAHDAADSGNPLKVGFKSFTALPAAVATADRSNGIADVFGRQLTAHIDASMQIWKSYNDTTSRAAGSAQIIWTPAGGKKIVITSVTIATYGTTAARMFLFFAAAADLTYTAGTDQPVFVGSFAPSSTSKPGLVFTPAVPIIANTADYKLLYQNDAALSVDIVCHGYEL